jgi:hypothetical protein
MSKLNNPVEIFKLLNKSNCRDCMEKTCMAFAAAVFSGKRQLGECPHIDQKAVVQAGGPVKKTPSPEQDSDELMAHLKKKIAGLDIPETAGRVGGTCSKDRLTIKIFGKDFTVDKQGNLSSDIHINPWVATPFLDYILTCEGIPVSGDWVSFRELKGGKSWQGLFSQRCEKPLKRIADTYTDFFEDLIHLFNGRKVVQHFESDISLVLHPLPKFPILICYWKPEEGLESDLKLFFDSTGDRNMNIESIYGLIAGLVRMFEKIALRHGMA